MLLYISAVVMTTSGGLKATKYVNASLCLPYWHVEVNAIGMILLF